MNEMNLFKRCHVNTNDEGDRFVGVKADSNDAVVYFPIGYELPRTEQELRRDIVHLIYVLSSFAEKKDKLLNIRKFMAPQTVDFPIHAYMTVINYFLQSNGYYTEKEQQFKVSDRGKTDWPRTIKRQRPILQANGSPVYLKRETRDSAPNDRNLITKIHEYCVFEGFTKLGWLFTAVMPKKPSIPFQKKMFTGVVQDKLGQTFNDQDKQLFQSMLAMINYIDERSPQKQFYFGTDRFEYVWERLIDRVFGVKNKNDYFPRTRWMLDFGKVHINPALEPDTVMVYNGKVYILDAKYYRYGVTGNPLHLPASSSINKQITYGEYVATEQKFKEMHGNNVLVYNAFIMPFDRSNNLFGFNTQCGRIGEATGDWKSSGKTYERVQGVVADVRYLMWHYTGNTEPQIIAMVDAIESAFADGDTLPVAAEV